MPPQRQWRCTYTKDTHKRPKNAKWVDGVLTVSVAGDPVAKLFAVDDDNNQTGDCLGQRKLAGSEFDALEDGECVKNLAGHDVQPDEEIGGDCGGDASEVVNEAKPEDTSRFARGRPVDSVADGTNAKEIRRTPAVRRAFVAPAMRRRPVQNTSDKPVSLDTHTTKRKSSEEIDVDLFSDSEDTQSDEALAKFYNQSATATGFADLYRSGANNNQGNGGVDELMTQNGETHREYGGTRIESLKPPRGVPNAATRQSKWAEFDTSVAGTRRTAVTSEADTSEAYRRADDDESTKQPTQPFVSFGGGSSGGVSDLARALARAGTGGVEGLASLVTYDVTGDDANDFPVFPSANVIPKRVSGTKPSAIAPPVEGRAPFLYAARRANSPASPAGQRLVDQNTNCSLRSLAFPGDGNQSSPGSTAHQHSFGNVNAYKTYFQTLLRSSLGEKLQRARRELEQCTRVPFAPGTDDFTQATQISKQIKSNRANQSAYHADCALRFETFGGAGGQNGSGKNNSNNNSSSGWKNKTWKKRKQKRNWDDDNDETDTQPEIPAAPTTKTFLYLKSAEERRGTKGYRRYSKGDLWVLSNTPRFVTSDDQTRVGDKTKAPFAALAKSLWHGPDKEGKLEVVLLDPTRPSQLRRDRHAYVVFALRVGDTREVFQEYDAFTEMAPETFPLLPHVCGPPLVRKTLDLESTVGVEILETSASLIEQYNLNDDQANAVAFALRAGEEAFLELPAKDLTVSPVRLVHGPFGSGKTTLLGAFIVSMAETLKRCEQRAGWDDKIIPPKRILVTAHTNVAVDKVLGELLSLGFTDFVRVGSLRRIDRKILPHSLHVTASVSSPSPGGPGKGDGAGSGPGGGFHDADASPVLGKNGRPLRGKGLDHARELRSMLRDATSVAEKTLLTRELNETQAGKADQRARLLGKCRVVGTTAASCGNDSLNGAQFSIVVLDESSQMTELGSVCAIVKFGVRALLAVGDPKQLPPVVGDSGTGGGKQVGGNTTAAPKNSLRECLFTRLQLAGHVPTLLRTQYRCHPALARVPNESFYGGELLNGVTEPQRERLLLARVVENLGDDGAKRRRNETPMPPLVWMDLTLTDLSWDSGRSAYSKREARLAAAIATRAVGLGVCPSRVGVIALFKAQASLIQRELDEICANSQQHTQQDMRDMSSGPDDTPSLYAETHRIQVSTVDAFQGQEKEFVVLSLCGGGGRGFLTDERLNVALTRARRHLVVLGDSRDSSLRDREVWRSCLASARKYPCGYVHPSLLVSETAITAKLMEWRAAGDAAEVAEKGSGEDAKESTKQSPTKQSPTKQSPTNDDVIVIDSKSALNTADSRRALNTADTVESPGGARGGALGGDPPNKATRTKKIHQAPRKIDTDSPDTYNFCDPDDPGGGNPFSGVRDPIVLSGDPDSLYVKSPARGRAVLTPVKRNAKRRKPFLKIVPNAAEVVETEEGLTPRKQGLPPTETADETVTETVETFPASPDPDVSSLPPARLEFHAALKAIGFDPKTYWRSYADMHRAVLYGDRSARDRIEFSPVGALLATHFSFATSFPWTKASTRRVMTNEILPGMATFIHVAFGWRWTRLSNLIAEFGDSTALANDFGFGAHVLLDAETQEADEQGAECFAGGGDASKAFA